MRNISKIIFLACVGVLVTLTFYSFKKFDVHSQTNKTSDILIVSNGAVNTNNSEVLGNTNQSNTFQTRGDIIKRNPVREGVCSSGFSEIPVELQQTYAEQNKRTKNETNSQKDVYPLKNEVNFHAFTYPFNDSSELKRDETQCTNTSLEPEKIKFVNSQVNKVVKKYISAMIHNETQISESKRKLSENPNIKNNVDLCLEIECGTENPKGEKKSFDIVVYGDLVYARSYSDTQIFVNALNKIRSISQSDESQYLADSEITQILAVARKIALTKLNDINK